MVWSRHKVIEEIKELEKSGIRLNAQNAKENYGGLYNASYTVFGSWEKAINAAGLDYEAIKRETKCKAALKVTKWTKEIIIKRISELHKNNESLASSKVRIKNATLRAAARDKFGSWKKAIEAAGFDYKKINLRADEESWNKEKITNRILLIYKEGGDISYSHLRKFNNSLVKAGINHFGNWRKAVESAGIVYDNILKCVPYKWNKQKVIEELNRLHELNEELNDTNISKNHNALYNAGRKYFGSWKSAIESAGFDYEKITHFRHNFWSKEKITEKILQLYNEGVKLNDSDIARTNGDLRSIACKYFGSWRKAINSSGLTYNQICKDLNEEARKGFLFEKYCKQMFEVLNPSIKRQTKPVVSDCIPDFIDKDLGEWIEIKLNCWGKGVNETIDKYLKYVDELIIIYLIGKKPRDRENVHFIPIDNFYPHLELAGKQELIENLNQLKKGIFQIKHQTKLKHFVK